MSLVELYYSDTCADCHNVRTMLIELLPKGVSFKEVNALQGEGLERAKRIGISSVPAIALDGELLLVGRIDRDDIKYLLDTIHTV
ncbi:MAG: thioredoxin family protein [ANME-2 cluster archaeon]|nr:thioredoxin family protein [ANME-2 cluster archaeon]MDF1558487.1 glutaredoxin domain-containing protein [ANME-2 cluster archaeon]